MKNEQSYTDGMQADWSRSFWLKAFAIYAVVELFILSTQYFITYNQCADCVLPPVYYFVNFIQHLLFTGLLWYMLDKFYYSSLWKLVLVNILAFWIYYFLWLGTLYAIFNSGLDWLVSDNTTRDFRSFVYGSWTDIGKYVLKVSAFYMVRFYFDYRKAEAQRIKLAVINKDMQLNLLKQQLSPHFYFNTLNNLYGLARSNNQKLSNALNQLSNIMQYVIVDGNQSKVLLKQEINFLQSYIALEKLRYEKDTVIEMEVRGDAKDLAIPPLLLIQFVENAFKHGMKEKSTGNWMKVAMEIKGTELHFNVNNSKYELASSKGIGINSVKHILDLQYENKHELKMSHEDNRFSVNLKMNLS